MGEGDSFKYWAFISYSHADEAWAGWLHRALERYRVPKRLVGSETTVGPVPPRLFPIFRDRDELSGSSELGPALQRALEQSRFLIVIASPRSAESRWVDEEIRYFKALGRSDRVLALIVDGTPGGTGPSPSEQECFPPALRLRIGMGGAVTAGDAEPIAADARPGRDGKANALLKLIAGVLGLSFDDLRQRELLARNRRLAATASIAVAISAVTVVLAGLAYEARNDALRRQQQAEDLLQFMLGDLREKLEPIGKLSILDAVGEKAMAYFATLDQEDVTDNALVSRATALRQIGDVRIKQGDMQGALEAFEEAIKLDYELASRHPGDASLIKNVGVSEYWMGYAHYVKGEFEQARPWWERRARTAKRLSDMDPTRREWIQQVVDAHISLGALAFSAKNLETARSAFGTALTTQQKLVDLDQKNRSHLETLAKILGWLSNVEGEGRNWNDALAHSTTALDLLRQLYASDMDNARYHQMLVMAGLRHTYFQVQLAPLDPGSPILRRTLELAEELAARDSQNLEYARTRTIALNQRVEAQIGVGDLVGAELTAEQVLALALKLFDRAPTNAQVADDVLAALIQNAKLSWLRGNRASAMKYLNHMETLKLSDEQKAGIPVSRWLDFHLLQLSLSSKSDTKSEVNLWLERAMHAGQDVAPDLLLRYEALSGNSGKARSWYKKLSPGERQHPFLKRFCQDYPVCVDEQVTLAPKD